MNKKKFLGSLVAASALFLAACGGGSNESKEVTVGVVGEINEPWEHVIKELKEKENIAVTLQKFTDYATPNTALADGSIDLNSFQTEIFLDEYNKNAGEDLTVIGYTVMAPLGIYSLDVKDVADLPDGAEIGIPNDGSNNGRALNLLQTAGLIEVDPAAGLLPTLNDITANPHNFVFHELDSSLTARSLEDLDASVINSGMAVDAGFIPTEDAIFLEPVSEESAPYYNTIVAHPDNVDNEVFKTIVEYYQTEGTAEVIKESSKGSSIPIWDQVD